MNGLALYNEIDPYAAQWIRNMIAAGLIPPGLVDERSIEDLEPDYVRQFTQFHTCAGIAVWALALRAVGWPDDRPVWTGSFPCQPFSAAGKGLGFADERHIWPAGFHLVTQCEPAVMFGEQSASAAGITWLDLVQTDMEAVGYAFGAVPFPSAGVGAPHIRDRTYWVAHANGERRNGRRASEASDEPGAVERPYGLCDAGGVEDADLPAAARQRPDGGANLQEQAAMRPARGSMDGGLVVPAGRAGLLSGQGSGLADPSGGGRREERTDARGVGIGNRAEGIAAGPGASGSNMRPGPVNGFWRASDWLFCRDGKWRPVEPETFPLAHGVANRAAQLRAYGNAINLEAAKAFILSSGLI